MHKIDTSKKEASSPYAIENGVLRLNPGRKLGKESFAIEIVGAVTTSVKLTEFEAYMLDTKNLFAGASREDAIKNAVHDCQIIDQDTRKGKGKNVTVRLVTEKDERLLVAQTKNIRVKFNLSHLGDGTLSTPLARSVFIKIRADLPFDEES